MPRASLRSVLLICAFNTARMCRVSTQITGESASAGALNSHCDRGPAFTPMRATARCRSDREYDTPPSNAPVAWCGRCAATPAAAGEKLTGSERSRVVPPAPAERRNASSISTALLKAVRGDEIEQISRAVNSPHQQNEDADRDGRSAAGPEQE